MVDFSVTCCSDRMNQLVFFWHANNKSPFEPKCVSHNEPESPKPRGSRAVTKLQSDRHGSILRRRWWCTSLSADYGSLPRWSQTLCLQSAGFISTSELPAKRWCSAGLCACFNWLEVSSHTMQSYKWGRRHSNIPWLLQWTSDYPILSIKICTNCHLKMFSLNLGFPKAFFFLQSRAVGSIWNQKQNLKVIFMRTYIVHATVPQEAILGNCRCLDNE